MKKSMWKKLLTVGLVGITAVGLLAGCGGEEKKEAQETVQHKIGLVQIVQHPALDEASRGITDGLTRAGLEEGKDFVMDRQNAQGDQSNLDTIVRRFIYDKDELIFAVATPAAQAVANATKEIPIVGTAITSYEAANLVKSEAKPETNVTGTHDRTDIPAQVDLILELTPDVKVLGAIYNSSEINSQLQVEELTEIAEAKGLTVREYTVSNVNDIPQAAAQLAGEVDAVYVPTDNVVASALPALIAVTNEKNIPVYGAEKAHVSNGAMASLSVDFYQLGLRAGEMGAAILRGESKPQEMPVEGQQELTLVIHQGQADLLGVTIPEELKAKAEIVE